ncbi:glycosyl transferase, partial [bacterium]|nr:glycosyl transferase [bacterium]
RRALSERNKTFVMLICYPASALFFLFPTHIFLFFLEGMLLSLLKQEKKIWQNIYWNCFKELFKNKKLLQKKRHQAIIGQNNIKLFSFLGLFSFMPHKLLMLAKHGLPKIKS